jgi:hypothetical protein
VGIGKDKFDKITDPLGLAGGKAHKWADPLGIIYKEEDTSAADAAKREAERQRQIAKTIGEIDATYDSDARKAQIAQYGADLLNKLTGDVNERKVIADRDLKFALARSGQTGGSVAIDQNAQLGNDYQKAILDVARRSNAGMADLRGGDAQSRLQLISLAQQGLSSGSAAAQAAASMGASLDAARNASQNQQLGDLFTGVASAKKYSEEAAARRRADKTYASLYPGAVSTGGFR